MTPSENEAVTIELDRVRTVRYTFRSLVALEKATGQSMLDGGALLALVQKPTATALRSYLWAGLIADDPALTLEQTDDLIPLSGGKLIEIVEAVISAWNLCFGVKAEPESPLA